MFLFCFSMPNICKFFMQTYVTVQCWYILNHKGNYALLISTVTSKWIFFPTASFVIPFAQLQQEIVKLCAVYHVTYIRNETLNSQWPFWRHRQDFILKDFDPLYLWNVSLQTLRHFYNHCASFIFRFLGNVISAVA